LKGRRSTEPNYEGKLVSATLLAAVTSSTLRK